MSRKNCSSERYPAIVVVKIAVNARTLTILPTDELWRRILSGSTADDPGVTSPHATIFHPNIIVRGTRLPRTKDFLTFLVSPARRLQTIGITSWNFNSCNSTGKAKKQGTKPLVLLGVRIKFWGKIKGTLLPISSTNAETNAKVNNELTFSIICPFERNTKAATNVDVSTLPIIDEIGKAVCRTSPAFAI
mmetsp:Transcript_14956/g.19625  ORF Transcript_14956/g.19625 Transcript_14956/m.19625 type:complete len:190 (-) Transcript_14956:756-1325(-)